MRKTFILILSLAILFGCESENKDKNKEESKQKEVYTDLELTLDLVSDFAGEGGTMTMEIGFNQEIEDKFKVEIENSVEGQNILYKEDGATVYYPCLNAGMQSIVGKVDIYRDEEVVKSIDFETEFDVKTQEELKDFIPPFNITLENEAEAFIAGKGNNITISAVGIPADRLNVAVTGGTIEDLLNGEYVITPNTSKVTISLSAEIQGELKEIGQQEFEVISE